jgi:nicotinamidase-related amidase
MKNSLESNAWEHIIRVPEVELDYGHSALLIVDLQYLTASRNHGMFKGLREAGLAEEAEYAIGRIENVVVPNVARLIAAYREASAPVVYARCGSVRGDGSDQTARHRAQGLVCPVWSKEAQILDEIAPEPGEILLTKSGSGCFTSTNLDHTLRNMGVTTTVLVGMWTNSCVETTARHAGDLDYGCVLVEDGCVAMTPENHRNALNYLDNNFCFVKSTEQVLAAVKQLERAHVVA